MRIPTDAEINEAAVRLDLAVDGRCPPSLRGRVARTLQLAHQEDAATEAAETTAAEQGRARAAGVDEICNVHHALAERLGPYPATAITAALAPSLYRTALERNRTHAPQQ